MTLPESPHPFRHRQFHLPKKLLVAFVPKQVKIQPIETKIVAQELFTIGQGQPLNKIINIDGKEILELNDIVKSWLSSQSKSKLILSLPLIGKINKAVKNGELTCIEKSGESISWTQWLNKKYNSM